MASECLQGVLSHLKPTGVKDFTQKNPDDVVVTCALRTPLTKAGKGGLKDTPFENLLVSLMKSTIEKSRIDPKLVEDIVCGNVNEAGAAYRCRAAALAAGFPNTTACASVNRFCSSGLFAVQTVADQIVNNSIEIMMSAPGQREALSFSEELLTCQEAQDCLQPMGQTSENIGKDFNITRELQDRWAAQSYQRAEAPQKAGWFKDEICPIKIKVKDPKTGQWHEVTVTQDDGIRAGTTFEPLQKICPAFPKRGDKSTGENSSQVTDGAAARLGQPILAKFVGATVTGCAPMIMGIGPSVAIPKPFEKYGIAKDNVDIFEINEAFASMMVYCMNKLGLDPKKVNPRGGAIAIGHPLGATGARQVSTILSEARRQKAKVLVSSMCIGTGQGMAAFVGQRVHGCGEGICFMSVSLASLCIF
ncbi:thiolase [Terfezia boudieri ATCC MYA-4762]|uniref:Thiolase n=1 Tax=Terfezia boudieri ATCC MYA-4762 TaxID=1051890 RepID=A0A3N4LMP0_9PEZI|nr:thiolase [Terfezia boudieri ATCC MYA-4762]